MAQRDFPTYRDSESKQRIHYTCQSIDPNKLKKKGIQEIGEQYGIESGEVLGVPEKVLQQNGYQNPDSISAQIHIENILRKL